MRLGGVAKLGSAAARGLGSLAGGLPPMARVVVDRPQVLQAVVVPGDDVVDLVGPELPADVAAVAEGGEDGGANTGSPVGR